MNDSLQIRKLLFSSLVFALLSFAASFLIWPMQVMLTADRYGPPGTEPFAALLAVICILVFASWVSLFAAFTRRNSESDGVSFSGWSGSILTINGLTCAFIVVLVGFVWRDLDSIGAARVSRALIVIASVQFFVALVTVVNQFSIRTQPVAPSAFEDPGDQVEPE